MSIIMDFKTLSKKRKIQLGIFTFVFLLMTSIAVVKAVGLLAEEAAITNQATLFYQENGEQKQVLSNIASTTLTSAPDDGEPVLNSRPTITKSTFSRTRSGAYIKKVRFTVYFKDTGDRVWLYVCKTNAVTNKGCSGGAWCRTDRFIGSSPIIKSWLPKNLYPYNRTRYYYAFVCDDEGLCSKTSSGSHGKFTP